MPHTVLTDGAGGVFIGAQFNNEGGDRFPIVNAPFASVPAGGAVLHVVPESRWVANVDGEIVLYAEDVATVRGNWRLEEDNTAALGRKLRNPNLSLGKLGAPLAAPADYVEFQFHAESGVSYHLWMRGRADANNWANDSVFVQFSDSVDASGAPTARIGSASGMTVNLEDCTSCGIKGWGWQDNGYGANVLGTAVRFTTTGVHTVRVQRREDGYAFDQLVLSASRFLTTSPGPLKQASTVLAQSSGQPTAEAEVVLHMTNAQTHGAWTKEARPDAASATDVRSPNAGAAKVVTVPVPAVNYFELRFDAEAGRPYHLWIRGIAASNYWGNDGSCPVLRLRRCFGRGALADRHWIEHRSQPGRLFRLRPARVGMAGQRVGRRRERRASLFRLRRYPRHPSDDAGRWLQHRPDRAFADPFSHRLARSIEERHDNSREDAIGRPASGNDPNVVTHQAAGASADRAIMLRHWRVVDERTERGGMKCASATQSSSPRNRTRRETGSPGTGPPIRLSIAGPQHGRSLTFRIVSYPFDHLPAPPPPSAPAQNT